MGGSAERSRLVPASTKSIAILAALLIATSPVGAQEVPMTRSQKAVAATSALVGAAGLGVSTALMVSTGWFPNPAERLFIESASNGEILLVAVPTIVTFTAAYTAAGAVLGNLGAGASFHPLVGVPVGALGGAVSSGLAAAAGWMVMFAVGESLGVITSGDIRTIEALGWAFLGGMVFGGMAGLVPGAVIVPTVRAYVARE